MLLYSNNSVCIAANNYNEGTQKLAEAYYIDSGLRDIMQDNIDKYKKKLPEPYKTSLQLLIPISDVIIKQRIEYNLEF